MVARKLKEREPTPTEERVLGAAGSFTGLWALTWLGTSALGAGAVVQGGFAVGGVMAASGLTVLWWNTRTLKDMHPGPETPHDEASDAPAESRAE